MFSRCSFSSLCCRESFWSSSPSFMSSVSSLSLVLWCSRILKNVVPLKFGHQKIAAAIILKFKQRGLTRNASKRFRQNGTQDCSLILVYTVCPDLSIQILRIMTVNQSPVDFHPCKVDMSICHLRGVWLFEPTRDKTNKKTCAPSEDSDQPGHPPSLIRVFAVRMKKAWVLSYPLSA